MRVVVEILLQLAKLNARERALGHSREVLVEQRGQASLLDAGVLVHVQLVELGLGHTLPVGREASLGHACGSSGHRSLDARHHLYHLDFVAVVAHGCAIGGTHHIVVLLAGVEVGHLACGGGHGVVLQHIVPARGSLGVDVENIGLGASHAGPTCSERGAVGLGGLQRFGHGEEVGTGLHLELVDHDAIEGDVGLHTHIGRRGAACGDNRQCVPLAVVDINVLGRGIAQLHAHNAAGLREGLDTQRDAHDARVGRHVVAARLQVAVVAYQQLAAGLIHVLAAPALEGLAQLGSGNVGRGWFLLGALGKGVEVLGEDDRGLAGAHGQDCRKGNHQGE